MRLGELRALMEDLAETCDAAGNEKAAADFVRVARWMDGDSEMPIETFLSRLRAALAAMKAPETEVQVAPRAVDDYLRRIAGVGTDLSEFDKVYSELEADALVGDTDAERLAQGYIGSKARFRSKKDALRAIRSQFIQRRYEASTDKTERKSTPW